ncbi:MAG: glycosyltransferase family 4 protein [Steroidobacteraceae bacterium]|nr:glycosyltransferase family 4 protein [Steroidobacteraceae bacterium]
MTDLAAAENRNAQGSRATQGYRIAMVAACPMPSRRGTPLRVERLANALWSRGHEVELITYHIADDQQAFAFPVHRIFRRPLYWRMPAGPNLRKLALYDPALAYKLWRVLAKGRFDVVHAHHVEGLLTALPARLSGQVPIVYDAHTTLASELPSYGPVPGRPFARLFGAWADGVLPRRADHIIAVTTDIRDRLVQTHGIPEDRITVVTNGVELERFSAPAQRHAGIVRILYSGTLARYQNVDLLLESFARAHRVRSDLLLVLSVSSSFEPYVGRVTRLGIRDAIEVLPDAFELLPERLAAAAMAVVPRTTCEGIPQKLLNYMAAAKPIVASAGSAKVIEQGRTGLVVPNGDADAFAAAMLRLANDPVYARELGHAAREHVAAHYSWELAAERVERVYDGLVGRRGSTPREVDRTSRLPIPDSPNSRPV